MEQDIQAFLLELQAFVSHVGLSVKLLLLPSRQFQIGLIVVLVAISQLVRWLIAGRVHEWIRGLEGLSKAQLRFLINLQRRIALITFVGLCWTVILVMREVMGLFPSRTYILEIVATIALAWLLIGIATRFIGNPLMRRIVSWGAWVYATLYFTGLLDDASALLDSIGLEIQSFRLSLLSILQGLVIVGTLVFLARATSNAVSRRIRESDNISPTLGVLLSKVFQALLYVSAVFLGLRAIGFDPTGLTVLSGAIGVGIGFGLQKIVSNIVSGIIILMDESVKPGDVISLGETFGWIQSLGARYVSVVTRDGREYLIPNEDLITGQVVNWTHSDEFVRLDLAFGAAYASDPYTVRRAAIEAALSVKRVLKTRQPVCHITNFGDSSIDYVLRFWITDPTQGLTNVRGDVYLALWDAFAAAGIQIPFPQREVRLLNEPAVAKSQPSD